MNYRGAKGVPELWVRWSKTKKGSFMLSTENDWGWGRLLMLWPTGRVEYLQDDSLGYHWWPACTSRPSQAKALDAIHHYDSMYSWCEFVGYIE